MLRLENITKEYVTGDSKVEALKGITLQFRKNEFVSILGQSGCGKTTLLNIIGGLDRYTTGDLVINGKSTKEFKDMIGTSIENYNQKQLFNAETFIVGLCAGLLGIGVTLLLNIPINMVIGAITDISGLASLPVMGGIILVLISMILTIIAGLIPARMASKKDPVEALRTE